MSRYSDGARAEYSVAKYLWEDGWWVVRQAASGGVRHEACDVMACKGLRQLVMEVKTGELPIRLDDQLLEAANRIDFTGRRSGIFGVYVSGSEMYYTDGRNSRMTEDNLEPFIRLVRDL